MNRAHNKGFTIIELMLAMTFIALLLMAIAMTTIQISNIYNRGITLREVNQAGRSISDDMIRTIAQSQPFIVDTADATSRYIVRTDGGRLCTGRATYAWNYGAAIRSGTSYNIYSASTDQIRFVKVNDPGGSLCDNPNAAIVKSAATEMLNSGDRDLVVHKLTVLKGAEDLVIQQTLYSIGLVIGTNNAAQLVTNNTSCKAPSEGVGNEDYCSVNQFDITARAGNKVQDGN